MNSVPRLFAASWQPYRVTVFPRVNAPVQMQHLRRARSRHSFVKFWDYCESFS